MGAGPGTGIAGRSWPASSGRATPSPPAAAPCRAAARSPPGRAGGRTSRRGHPHRTGTPPAQPAPAAPWPPSGTSARRSSPRARRSRPPATSNCRRPAAGTGRCASSRTGARPARRRSAADSPARRAALPCGTRPAWREPTPPFRYARCRTSTRTRRSARPTAPPLLVEEVLVTNVSGLLPSQVTDDNWIYADSPAVSEADLSRTGKWLVFVPARQVDRWWALIRLATEQGRLGISAKAATARHNDLATSRRTKLICAYTRDWQDQSDVRRVLRQLRGIGVTPRLSYKTN